MDLLKDMNPAVTLLLGLFGGGALATLIAVVYGARREDRSQAFNHLNTIIVDLRARTLVLETGMAACQEGHAIDKEKIGRLETGLVECQAKHEADKESIYELRRDLHMLRNRLAACPQCHGQLPSLPPLSSPEESR